MIKQTGSLWLSASSIGFFSQLDAYLILFYNWTRSDLVLIFSGPTDWFNLIIMCSNVKMFVECLRLYLHPILEHYIYTGYLMVEKKKWGKKNGLMEKWKEWKENKQVAFSFFFLWANMQKWKGKNNMICPIFIFFYLSSTFNIIWSVLSSVIGLINIGSNKWSAILFLGRKQRKGVLIFSHSVFQVTTYYGMGL